MTKINVPSSPWPSQLRRAQVKVLRERHVAGLGYHRKNYLTIALLVKSDDGTETFIPGEDLRAMTDEDKKDLIEWLS